MRISTEGTERENRKEKKSGEERVKIISWNIAGLKNKEENFWKYVERFSVVGMQETWLDEKGWEETKEKMSKEHTWFAQHARKDNIKGRNMGGMVVGIRKGIEIKEVQLGREGIIEVELKMESEEWKIIFIYNRGGESKKLQEIKERIEERAEGNQIVVGDFNARTGNRGGTVWQGEEEQRNSRDRTVNVQGEELLQVIEENGLGILNGNVEGDGKGEWTFIGQKGSSVIDYAITNAETWDKINKLRIGERTESDHQPIEIEIEEKEEHRREEEEEETEIEIEDWSEEGTRKFREKLKEIRFEKEGIQEGLGELVEKIRGAITRKTVKVKKWRIGRKRWWNKECRESKTRLNRKLREYKGGRIDGKEFAEEKRRHKKICKENEEKKRKEEIEKIMNIKDEKEIWKYIRKERGKKGKLDDRIAKNDWKQHFMNLLEGREEWIEKERRIEKEGGEAKEIKREEIEEAIGKLKKKKSAGVDGIRNEVWKNANEEVKERLREIMNEIWKGKGWPEEWKEGIICPIHKKGERTKTSNYRGVTLMCTGYKIFAMIVEKRLREEAERLKLLPETQAGFRKGRSGIDNIYILKTAAEKAINKKKGKLYVFFVDLKAAFDKIRREKVWKHMRGKGIRVDVMENIEEIYRETRSKVRSGKEQTEAFWTEKGVRQGCPLSPLLFILFLADIEEYLRKGQEGGITIGNKRVYTLAYADDLAIIAETRKEMERMIGYLKKYFKEKELEVNVEKSKIMVFSKGRRRKKEEWKWEDQEIEEVTEFKYLGYTFKYNNKDDAHIQEIRKRATAAMVQIWSIGERKFGGDFRRRMVMFNSMVKSIFMYAVEIWGVEVRKEIESIQVRYIKNILGLERCTPGYLVREETKTERIMIEAGERVIKFEEKIKKSENELLRQCRKEMDKENWKETRIGKTREELYEKAGMNRWEAEARDDKGENVTERWRDKVMEMEREERERRLEKSTYNGEYKRWRTEGIPKYLQVKSKGQRMKMIARFRVGNEWKASRHWMKEEKKMCRLCEEEIETGTHVMKECHYSGAEERIEELMSEEGQGIEWMRRLKDRREGKSIV